MQAPTSRPALPAKPSTAPGLTIQGRQLAAMVERANYHEGWRWRPSFSVPVIDDAQNWVVPAGAAYTLKIPWWYEPESLYLHVAYSYYALVPLSGGNIRVDAQLNSPTGGGVIDAGCRWDLDSGSLQEIGDVDDVGRWRGPGTWTSTGWDTDRQVDLLVPSLMPRVLHTSGFGGGAGQKEIELEMTFVNVRPYVISVWEMWTREL